MFRKLCSIILAALLIGLISIGCSELKGNVHIKKDIILAGIYKDLSQVWFINESKATKEMAISMGAKDMLLIDAQMNPDTYLVALDNIIAKKVDGLIVCVPDQKLSKLTVEKCKAAGIPVMAVDDGLIDENGKHIAPALELDAYRVGQQMGDFLADYVKAENMIKNPDTTGYLILSVDTVSSCKPRSEGQLDAWNRKMPEFPKGNIFKVDSKGSSEEAFTVTAATLAANQNINTWFVTTVNDEGAQGATKALEQAGLSKNAVVVGLGGYLAKDEFKRKNSCFLASAYIQAKEDGETVAKAMMDYILSGKEIFGIKKNQGKNMECIH